MKIVVGLQWKDGRIQWLKGREPRQRIFNNLNNKTKMDSKFKITQIACIKISGIVGEVIGRSDHKDLPMQYLVSFMEVGVAKKDWFFESELSEVDPA